MAKKLLEDILPEGTEIPKSYQRFLTYSVYLKQGDKILVETPRGNLVTFELSDNYLKQLKNTPEGLIYEENKSTDTIKITKRILPEAEENISLETAAPVIDPTLDSDAQMIKVLAWLESLEKRISALERRQHQAADNGDLVRRIKRLEAVPEADKALAISPVEWQTLNERIAALEQNHPLPLSAPRRSGTTKIFISRSLLLPLLKGSWYLFCRTGSGIYRGMHKLGYRNLAIVSSVIAVIVLFLWWQPWTYLARPKSQPSSPGITANSSKNNDNPKPTGRLITWDKDDPKSKAENSRKAEESLKKEVEGLPEISKWIKASQSRDIKLRRQAAQKLGELASPSTVSPLKAMLDDQDDVVRVLAIRSLGKVKDYQPAIFALTNVAADSRRLKEQRYEAIIALGMSSDVAGKKTLLTILKNTANHEELRSEAASALGRIGDSSISPELLPFLQDRSPLVRQDIAYTLGHFGYPGAAQDLLVMLRNDSQIDVQVAAAVALGKIPLKAKTTVPQLVAILKIKERGSVRTEIKKALKNLAEAPGLSEPARREALKFAKDLAKN